MASFTDTPYKFNPYVGTQPVQAMIDVGVRKQQQYDDGVQKIQGWIDEVSNLPVMRDIDKSYLQTLVNGVGSDLRKIAGADFSNQQLLHSVGGLTTKISKDKNILAGVQSTMHHQQELKNREEYKKSGKTAIENDADYYKSLNDYMQSTELGKTFDHNYSPYVDLRKKWFDIFKGLHVDERVNDIPFETFADGTPNYKKLGDVMVKIGVKGVDAAKIENAIRANLTPEDMNQMRISANYQFANVGQEGLAKYSKAKYDGRVTQVEGALSQAEKALVAARGDTAESARIQSSIDGYKKMLGDGTTKGLLASQFEDELIAQRQNPEEAKTEIYKNGFISEYANSLAWEDKSTQYVESPFTKVKQWNMDYQLKVQDRNLQIAKFQYEQKNDARTDERERLKLQLDMEKLHGVGTGFSTQFPVGTDVLPAAEAMINQTQGLIDQNDALRSEFIKRGVAANAADLDKKIAEYQNGKLTSVGVDVRAQMDRYISNMSDIETRQKTIDDATKEARKEVYKNKPTVPQLLSNRNPITITSNGQHVTFTPEEIYNYLKKETTTFAEGAPSTTPGHVPSVVNRVVDPAKLTSKERLFYNAIQERYQNGGADVRVGSPGNLVSQYLRDFTPVVHEELSREGEIKNLVNQKLSSNVAAWVPRVELISTTTKESRENLEGVSNLVLQRMREGQGDYADSHSKGLAKWLGDEKSRNNLTYSHFVQGNQHRLIVQNGDEKAQITLTPTEASQLPTKNQVMPDVMRAQERLLLGNGNTNIFGSLDKAYYRQTDFSKVKGMSVTADLHQAMNGQDVYLNLNIKTPSGWKSVQLDAPLNINDANTYIKTANKQVILKNVIEDLSQYPGNEAVIAELKKMF